MLSPVNPDFTGEMPLEALQRYNALRSCTNEANGPEALPHRLQDAYLLGTNATVANSE